MPLLLQRRVRKVVIICYCVVLAPSRLDRVLCIVLREQATRGLSLSVAVASERDIFGDEFVAVFVNVHILDQEARLQFRYMFSMH